MRIDRPAEDDIPRARPDSPAADTPPPVEHDPPDPAARFVEYRATVDAAFKEYQATRQWDEAVPALREAWEKHERNGIIRNGPSLLPTQKFLAHGGQTPAATYPQTPTPKSPAAAPASARSAKPSSPPRCAA